MGSFVLRLAPCARLACMALVLCTGACQREKPPSVSTPQTVPVAVDDAPRDVFERNAQSIVGISYPAGAHLPAGLARELQAYATTQRATLDGAIARRKPNDAPYELTLAFSQLVDSPRLIVIGADSSLYTGGASSRFTQHWFVWQRDRERLLRADELMPGTAGWTAVQAFLRDPAATTPEAPPGAPASAGLADPRQLVPRVNSQGQVFAVGVPTQQPGSAETAVVDVPADVVRPFIAPEFASWFAATPDLAGSRSATGVTF
ncbi:hypothetical protein [Lysobacter panacisoli]|uniref:DUF3298 and DUF4163 domain-containing protein n=1 Tax=Lysobacter panacisoli TaxID=1255263 RepID=A0ABP9LNN2_9GAMM|nr:hypothetical protein [Lysobacter panacisoli]